MNHIATYKQEDTTNSACLCQCSCFDDMDCDTYGEDWET